MARNVGDRATEAFGNAWGTVSEVREPIPGVFEYGIVWDDGNYADETWTEADLWPVEETEGS